jgi:hypothetical protein
MKKLALALALTLILGAPGGRAATIEITPGGSLTIQDAVNQALDGDVIQLAPGLYGGPGNHDIDLLGKAVTIRGAGAPAEVVIACQGTEALPRRGFLMTSGEGSETVLASLTITGGYAPVGITSIPGGGAVLITSAGSPRFEGCRFVANETVLLWEAAGGAVYADGDCSPTFVDCSFEVNRSHYGGAVGLNHFSTATFENCRFFKNEALRGGALWGNGNTKTGCVFLGNEAQQGGAVWQNGWNTDRAESCTFAGNSAPEGAAYYLIASYNATLDRCLVAENFQGAGIFATTSGSINLLCCNLNGNEGGDWVGVFAAQVDLAGNFSAPACFCDLPGGDAHLCADSWSLPGQHPWGCDDLVGALGAGCAGCDCPDQGPVATRRSTLSGVRSLYR